MTENTEELLKKSNLHNTVKFIRLVPESGVALVSGLQVSDDTLNQVEAYGYTIENY